MPENSNPIISQITTLVLFPGVIVTAFMYGLFGIAIWLGWGVCVGVIFLCEFLFGRRKKRFYKNIGAFIATMIMAVILIAAVRPPKAEPLLDERVFVYIAYLPPIIVSFCVNIGNIIYKLRSGNADKPSDPQP